MTLVLVAPTLWCLVFSHSLAGVAKFLGGAADSASLLFHSVLPDSRIRDLDADGRPDNRRDWVPDAVTSFTWSLADNTEIK
jgi:hypothetical protein